MSTLCLSSGHCANSRAHIRRVLESGGQSPHALLRSLETQLSGEKRVRGGVLERGGGGGGGLAAAKHSKVSWSGKFEELKQFWHRHGSANVTPNHPGLGGWSSRQRELFRQGRLASEHEALLRSLDFSFDLTQDDYDAVGGAISPRQSKAASLECVRRLEGGLAGQKCSQKACGRARMGVLQSRGLPLRISKKQVLRLDGDGHIKPVRL